MLQGFMTVADLKVVSQTENNFESFRSQFFGILCTLDNKLFVKRNRLSAKNSLHVLLYSFYNTSFKKFVHTILEKNYIFFSAMFYWFTTEIKTFDILENFILSIHFCFRPVLTVFLMFGWRKTKIDR